MQNPYGDGAMMFPSVSMDTEKKDQVVSNEIGLSKYAAIRPEEVLERYSSLSPDSFISTLYGAEQIPRYSFERVSGFARSLEGLNAYFRSQILSIRNSLNNSVGIPSLQLDEGEITAIHVDFWHNNDLHSEYISHASKVYKNHVGAFEGKTSSLWGYTVYKYTEPCRLIFLIATILLTLFGIWGLSDGIKNIGLFISSIMALSLAFTGVVYFFIDICLIVGQNEALPNITKIEDSIVEFYDSTIDQMNRVISRVYENERPRSVHDFAKFLIRHLFNPAYEELSFALSDEGPLKNVNNISKEQFEDYLMLYRFVNYRSKCDMYSVPGMETLAQRMATAIACGIFDGNIQLHTYLLSLFAPKTSYSGKKTPDHIFSINICNIGGSSLKERVSSIMRQALPSLSNNTSTMSSNNMERVMAIRRIFNQ